MNRIIIFMISTMFLFSCKQGSEDAMVNEVIQSEITSGAGPSSSLGKQNDEESNIKETTISMERKIIRTGDLAFESKNVNTTKRQTDSLVLIHQGYITDEKLSQQTYRTDYQITIKVPSENFNKLIADISGIAPKIDSKIIQSNDVTEEFIDVDARIKAKKVIESRYLDILTKANKISEILEIERELGNVRAEIESMEGRLKYLSSQVTMSTLTVNYYEVHDGKAGSLQSSEFIKAIKGGWDILVSFLIGVLYLWPFILIGIAGIFIFKRFRK